MPVPTHFDVEHLCGHSLTHDLSDKRADERAGFARWLGRRPCTDCWRAAKDAESETPEHRATRHAAEHAEARAWSKDQHLPPLEGSDSQIGFGEVMRRKMLTAAYQALVLDGQMSETDWEQVEERARRVGLARWWLDNKELAPELLPELLEASGEDGRGCENPAM
ncbi:hypothetical protein BIV57_21550 [Mangrovactinospora gilvigrisea]|uniref:Uncharacterized protein n=1 Tax=Mangrovactinospora gilvigrisea TaxID=1428644 RepID=A0A1J7B9T2_9ACTN|nr:hypothetical protein [Mangrovactinospora gilvigrisea]OIV35439.1 hypothetical protein BIV57_21550 [Mangrovactinospora gilvigrisea]